QTGPLPGRQREVEPVEQERPRIAQRGPPDVDVEGGSRRSGQGRTIPTPLLIGSGSKGRPHADLSAAAGSPRAPVTIESARRPRKPQHRLGSGNREELDCAAPP